jgi:hypothetical protein
LMPLSLSFDIDFRLLFSLSFWFFAGYDLISSPFTPPSFDDAAAIIFSRCRDDAVSCCVAFAVLPPRLLQLSLIFRCWCW